MTTGGGSALAGHWTLDPEIAFLNHGSFGACPIDVLEQQAALRAQMEREPVRFLQTEHDQRMDAARKAAAEYVGAPASDLGFVANATTGVNAVLRSLPLRPGDELLVTNHAYRACRNALDYVAKRAGSTTVVANVPFPVSGPHEVIDAVMGAVTSRTRLALIDHVTSPTGLVFPIADIVATLGDAGVDVLVDGAHAPGMVELDVVAIGAAYYTGNFHKWVCAPKSAGFLHVRPDRQDEIVPTVVSHGATVAREGRTRFEDLFNWTGTLDPTPYLCVPTAIDVMAGLLPGGWPEIRSSNRALALAARDVLCEALGIDAPAPDSMIGSMAAVPLPPGPGTSAIPCIQVPFVDWPSPPHRLVRVSAQLYNDIGQYRRLAEALVAAD